MTANPPAKALARLTGLPAAHIGDHASFEEGGDLRKKRRIASAVAVGVRAVAWAIRRKVGRWRRRGSVVPQYKTDLGRLILSLLRRLCEVRTRHLLSHFET